MIALTTPLQTAFEMQRQTTEASQQMIEDGMQIQQSATETFLENSMDTQRSVQKQWIELSRQMMTVPLDVLESTVNEMESTMRDAMDEQFEQNADRAQQQLNTQFEQNAKFTQELLNTQFDGGAELVQQLLNAQADAVQSALHGGTPDFETMLDGQFDLVADSQNEAWKRLETGLLDILIELNTQQRDLVTQSFENLTDVNYDAEYRAIEIVNQAEETA